MVLEKVYIGVQIEKFNPNHDRRGRFSSGTGLASGSGIETSGMGGGGGSGGAAAARPKRTASKMVGEHNGVRLRTSKDRAFDGNPKELTNQLTKQQAGALGENIAVAYLKSRGIADARQVNAQKNNYAVDVVGDHGAFEIKTGIASNGRSAQQWRATIGEPGPKEKAWLKTASPEAKAAHNAAKSQQIIARKKAALKDQQKALGLRTAVRPQTVAVILDTDRQIADVYHMQDFHLRVGWSSDQAQSSYVGSFRYDHS